MVKLYYFIRGTYHDSCPLVRWDFLVALGTCEVQVGAQSCSGATAVAEACLIELLVAVHDKLMLSRCCCHSFCASNFLSCGRAFHIALSSLLWTCFKFYAMLQNHLYFKAGSLRFLFFKKKWFWASYLTRNHHLCRWVLGWSTVDDISCWWEQRSADTKLNLDRVFCHNWWTLPVFQVSFQENLLGWFQELPT